MLNLRLVQPALLVDITRIPDLIAVDEDDEWISYGACVTHAAIEDGRVPDRTNGILPRIAQRHRLPRRQDPRDHRRQPGPRRSRRRLAYGAHGAGRRGHRLRRQGSAPHPGPRPDDRRVRDRPRPRDEILTAVHVPRLTGAARFGYYKICRKTGEFADAIGAVLRDPERGSVRGVAGATEAAPIVLDDLSGPAEHRRARRARPSPRNLQARGLTEAYELQVHAVALQRALAEALA